MLVKLTIVRVNYDSKESRQYPQLVYINPALVQYVRAVAPGEKDWETEVRECDDARTIVGFGPDTEFPVLETVQFVVDSINERN